FCSPHRQNFINDVSKNNSSLISGIMYAEGWRKAQVPNQIVGRYINQNKLNQQMTKKGFIFQEVASGAYDSCKNYLKEQSIPSLSKMNFNQKENYSHVDNDTDNWTLIGFIPIKKDRDLAFEDFDVEGGEFVIRDLKVFVDLPKVKGTTLFGFSCQISKNMSITMEKYHRDHYEDKNQSFGNYDDYIIKGKRKAA
ncbi:hypothetical protein PPACK8108_LOCUS4095, partial [Phakopsora pachyrhizi]